MGLEYKDGKRPYGLEYRFRWIGGTPYGSTLRDSVGRPESGLIGLELTVTESVAHEKGEHDKE